MVGVLGLQGDYEAHGRLLHRDGVAVRYVKRPEQLKGITGLIIPGGESTTLIKLMDAYHFWEPIQEFAALGKPILGTCAGMIILAREVHNPSQKAMGLMDIVVERNSYGRQIDSFEGTGIFNPHGAEHQIHMVFIRAPRIAQIGESVRSIAFFDGACVAVQQDTVILAAFHPELTDDLTLHRYFLELVGE